MVFPPQRDCCFILTRFAFSLWGIAHLGRGRVTQKAKMQFRRRFLDKWLSEKWVEPKGRGKYMLTDYGNVVVEVF